MARRLVSAGLLSALLLAMLHGCGSDAVGVDECRDIENARCVAGEPCGLVKDIDACKRFYRDQCLHGLASGQKPGKPVVDECVQAIERAGKCRKLGFKNLVDCPLELQPTVGTTLTEVCDVVEKPEKILECEFLYKPVELPDAGPETSDDGSADSATLDAPAE